MVLLTFRSFFIAPFLLMLGGASACSVSTRSSAQSREVHSHFLHHEAFWYRWASGARGATGVDHIFKFVPRKEQETEFLSISLDGGEAKKPDDIRHQGDTVVLMVQRTGSGLSGGKGSEPKNENQRRAKAASNAIVHYRIGRNDHKVSFPDIPKKAKDTRYE